MSDDGNLSVAESTEGAERILIVDDDPSMRTALLETVRRLGYAVQGAADGVEALERIAKFHPWLVLTDLKMPRLSGLELIKDIRARAPYATIVLMTAYGTVETAVEAMKFGASEYLLKPFSMDLLERVIGNLKAGREEGIGATPSAQMGDSRTILTQDPGMIRLLSTVESVAASQATVLIHGESGTGKELLARFIHNRSPRAHRPFVAVNCAALPDGLLESELFGHERGAFTGAIAQKIGRFELADGGTLFLDEVGDIPLDLQSKLLRVLQEQEFERLGSTRTTKVNVRLVAATNRDLLGMVAEKQFRSDLFYRLNVFPVTLPPLRDRREDIPLLVRYFAQKLARRMDKRVETIPAGVMAALSAYHWPGNIRELENMDTREGADDLHVPLNMAPSDLLRQIQTKE